MNSIGPRYSAHNSLARTNIGARSPLYIDLALDSHPRGWVDYISLQMDRIDIVDRIDGIDPIHLIDPVDRIAITAAVAIGGYSSQGGAKSW